MIYDIIKKVNHIIIFKNIRKEHLAIENFQDNDLEEEKRQ